MVIDVFGSSIYFPWMICKVWKFFNILKMKIGNAPTTISPIWDMTLTIAGQASSMIFSYTAMNI